MATKRQGADRRRFPRIWLIGDLHGRPVRVNEPFVLLEMSLGGFSVESCIPFPTGAEHPFEFTSVGGTTVLRGVAIHCMRVDQGKGLPTYTCGFAFKEDGANDRAAIRLLMNALQDMLNLRESGEAVTGP